LSTNSARRRKTLRWHSPSPWSASRERLPIESKPRQVLTDLGRGVFCCQPWRARGGRRRRAKPTPGRLWNYAGDGS
jgi:hypothetical protein